MRRAHRFTHICIVRQHLQFPRMYLNKSHAQYITQIVRLKSELRRAARSTAVQFRR
jgi:hypothetical protein